MKYLEWLKTEGINSYKKYCNCGGYAYTMNGRDPEHPHLHWCAQFKEYEDLYSKYLGENDEL